MTQNLLKNIQILFSNQLIFVQKISCQFSQIIVQQFSDAKKLKFVQAIFRHGDRAPGDLPYPLNLNNETVWPRGWDNLTEIGENQMMELGRFFKSMYGGDTLLGKNYGDKEISLQSSTSQRALDSAHAFLAAFCDNSFEYNSSEKSSSSSSKSSSKENDENYCPVILPSSINSDKGDALLKPTSYDCPAYDQKSQNKNEELFANLSQKYKDLFDFLAVKTGLENITFHMVAKLNDLNREIIHGLEQPDWLYKTWPQYNNSTTLDLVTELRRIERINEFNSPELAHLRGGILLADWIKRSVQVANDQQKEPSKMMLYSSHDGTLQALMNILNISDSQQIPYAASLIMEIYEEKKEFYVNFLYRSNLTLEKRDVPNCEKVKCKLDDFVSRFNSTAIYSIDDLNEECEMNNGTAVF